MLYTRILETCTECEYGIHGGKPYEMDGKDSCCLAINHESGAFDIHAAVWRGAYDGAFITYPDPDGDISWCRTYKRRTNAARKAR